MSNAFVFRFVLTKLRHCYKPTACIATARANYLARGSGCEVLWWAHLCVCVSVCLSVHEDISGITCTIFAKFVCMLPMAVAPSSSGRVRNSKGRGKFGGLHIGTVLENQWAWPEEQCVTWGNDPEGEWTILEEQISPTSPKPRRTANWTGPCSGVHMIRAALDCKRLTSLLSAAKVGWECTLGRSVISTIALLCLVVTGGSSCSIQSFSHNILS